MDGDIQPRPARFQAVLPGTKHGRKKSLPFLVVVVVIIINPNTKRNSNLGRGWISKKKKGILFLLIQTPTGIQLGREDESARTQSAGIGCREDRGESIRASAARKVKGNLQAGRGTDRAPAAGWMNQVESEERRARRCPVSWWRKGSREAAAGAVAPRGQQADKQLLSREDRQLDGL